MLKGWYFLLIALVSAASVFWTSPSVSASEFAETAASDDSPAPLSASAAMPDHCSWRI